MAKGAQIAYESKGTKTGRRLAKSIECVQERESYWSLCYSINMQA